jgi:hypothetical protein
VAELAWPCVALIAIGCATYLVRRLVLSRRVEERLHGSVVELLARAHQHELTQARTDGLAEDVAALQQRMAKLEMGKTFGRTG